MRSINISKSKLVNILVILLTLTWVSAVLISGLYARFASADNDSDGARVAKYDISVNNEFTSTIALSMKPGDTVVYTFDFVNNGETAMKYSVYAEAITNDIPYIVLDTPKTGILQPGGDSVSGVKYSISWNENDASHEYQGRVDYFRFIVKAEQVD